MIRVLRKAFFFLAESFDKYQLEHTFIKIVTLKFLFISVPLIIFS